MKNFFSQTWVVSILVIAVLGVVCYVAFKDKNDEQTTDPANEEKTE